ncbi:hypothetical protein DDZ13_01665 [Coraliomargarita sinensis]|uniref:TonB-dependent receptor n=1 Tax=Coraliomargarita sinensis TaxID=2174842 RepID=A0A317ZN42_9BACT|nr:TonB-dependent receptor [Coraliomargarita sinensis]PXA05607.1 hypothetical protein DDZ13_01665 [Coraliomargarita sinensis]
MHKLSIPSGAVLYAATSLFQLSLSGAEEPVYLLDEYIVSSGPVARSVDDFVNPFATLESRDIQRQGGTTLGALLEEQPGVSASSFAAGASRPIIRGFDGPRVRILDAGIEAADVSAASPDHAVAVEPILVDRVEVIRGPATLLYGSSAIGGVVNVIGKEIPRERVSRKGYEGAFESRYDTVSDGETFLGYGTVGGDNWALRVTGLTRKSEDYDIPGEAEIHHEGHDEHDDEDDHDEEHEEGESGTLGNSFVETDALSIGGTWFFGEDSYLGAAVSLYESFYGVPGHSHGHAHEEEEEEHQEESVAIDLERKRLDLELVLAEPIDWIEAARFRFGYTDYEHTELEGDETGTIFEQEGWELRGEAANREWAFIDEGVIGIQVSDTDFSAVGEEAFTPPSETQTQAIFTSQHMHRGDWHYEFGARLERQTTEAQGAPDDYDSLALSLAVGAIWNFATKQSLALSFQRSQRHPSSTELFADGPHLATSQYERGDADLDLETAYGLDLSYRYRSADWAGTFTVFYTRFDDYIFAGNTGAEEDELPVYQYTAVDADFWGFEAEGERVLYSTEDTEFTIGLLADYVRAEIRDRDEDLPRIPPLRIGVKAGLESGPWTADLLLRRAFNQDRTAPGETETDGYTELSLDIAHAFDLGNGLRLTAFAQANNLLDEDIRHHTSYLKDVAPLPGRSVTIGARFEF